MTVPLDEQITLALIIVITKINVMNTSFILCFLSSIEEQ